MILISASDLRQRVSGIFSAAGSSAEASRRVAHSLVESNLAGHDSHGVIRVPSYVRSIQSGRLRPEGQIRVIKENASTALLDCGYTFGQIAAAKGMDIALAKARQHSIAIVALQKCNHVGRLGEYVVMAAQQGYMGMIFCNGSSPGGIVAPYGGIARALGSNPIAWGIPGPDETLAGALGGKPLFMDFATSVCAQGKIQVAADEGKELPVGWLLDKEGRPTRNPNDQFEGGAMLPFGGHKGYALGVMIELLAGGLSGAGIPLQSEYTVSQGTVLVAVNIEAFQPLDEFRALVTDFVQRVKKTPRAEDCPEILVPGEPEWRSKEKREREGIPLPDRTWERLGETAVSLGMEWD
jgi:LDH2 family malate/lactate/ureidoglycolate dehydrogenase